MEVYVKIYFISIFSLLYFLIFKHDVIRCVHFTRIVASNTASMTSLIRSHVEYLVQTYHILVLNLKSKLMKNIALMAGLI